MLAPGHGHLYPTFGVASALKGAGHDVTYAMVGQPSFRERVEREGHAFVAVPPSPAEQREIVEAGLRDDPTLAGIFSGLAPPAVAPLVDLIGSTGARLVLHDMASFAAPLAAAIAGVPSAHFGVGPSFPEDAYDAGQRMAPMWEQWGRHPDALGGMFGLAYFDPFPLSLDNPARSLPVPRYPYRPDPLGSAVELEVTGLPRPPWVWVTLGTVFNANPEAWAHLAEELKDLDARVVATVGDGVELSSLAPFPPNFTALSFVPARAVLGGAVAVVCHGGAGTMLGALRYGLPLVCWPQGADQFHNSQACEAAGAGVTVSGPSELLQALRGVLDDDGYRSRAKQLQEELLAMPSAEECARVLEGLAGLAG